jgi:hypothetical protein
MVNRNLAKKFLALNRLAKVAKRESANIRGAYGLWIKIKFKKTFKFFKRGEIATPKKPKNEKK